MRRYHLAEFEEILLLTVAILRSEAYGVSVKKEIEQHLARKVSVGALQIALKQLEDKGYLKSYEGEVTSERSGKPRRYFFITALGKRAMEDTKNIQEKLWEVIPKVAFPKFAGPGSLGITLLKD